MLAKIWKWFLQGIALIAQVALTIALLVWLGTWSEETFGRLIYSLLPEGWYFKGLGLLSGIMITLGIGLAANLFLVRWIVQMAESVLERIPLVTSLFPGVQRHCTTVLTGCRATARPSRCRRHRYAAHGRLCNARRGSASRPLRSRRRTARCRLCSTGTTALEPDPRTSIADVDTGRYQFNTEPRQFTRDVGQ